MAADKAVESVASGFNYTVWIGCDRLKGKVQHGTADRIIGGWAATKDAAENKALSVLEDAE